MKVFIIIKVHNLLLENFKIKISKPMEVIPLKLAGNKINRV